MRLLKIIPIKADPGEPTRTRGTKVVTEDGREVEGVTKIELVAECNDVWRARIDCLVQVDGEIQVEVLKSDLTPKYGGYQPSGALVSNPPGDE